MTGPAAGAVGEQPVVCSTCGDEPGADAALVHLTWTLSVERGAAVWTCPRCSRENLRSIEGKLDPSWW